MFFKNMERQMPEIVWTGKATKQLLKLPTADGDAIEEGVEELQKWPNIPHLNVKKLTDDKKGRWRLAVGNYRVLWTVTKGEPVIIEVLEVLKRTTTTYRKR